MGLTVLIIGLALAGLCFGFGFMAIGASAWAPVIGAVAVPLMGAAVFLILLAWDRIKEKIRC